MQPTRADRVGGGDGNGNVRHDAHNQAWAESSSATRCGSAYAHGLAPFFNLTAIFADKSLPTGIALGTDGQPLQFDFPVMLPSFAYTVTVTAGIIQEIHHLTGLTVPLSAEVVATHAQINGGLHTSVFHTSLIGSTTVLEGEAYTEN